LTYGVVSKKVELEMWQYLEGGGGGGGEEEEEEEEEEVSTM
jgi:hypothetical protein